MADFDQIHAKAMKANRTMVSGELWQFQIKEPLRAPFTEATVENEIVVIGQLRCERTPGGYLVLRATPETAQLIKDWNIRHTHTEDSAFELPAGLLKKEE